MTGYYRKHIKNYGIICKPLTDLLKKETLFVWTPAAETAFQTLKTALISAPVLALPDFTKVFVIETDACDVGIGAVLMQDSHPLAYVSRALGPKNQTLSLYEKRVFSHPLGYSTVEVLLAAERIHNHDRSEELMQFN